MSFNQGRTNIRDDQGFPQWADGLVGGGLAHGETVVVTQHALVVLRHYASIKRRIKYIVLYFSSVCS